MTSLGGGGAQKRTGATDRWWGAEKRGAVRSLKLKAEAAMFIRGKRR